MPLNLVESAMTMTPHLSRLRGLSFGVLLCLLLAPARAEDIDIYGEPNLNGDLPNVLFVLDSSANWSSSIPAPTCYYKDNGVTTAVGPPDQGKKIAIEKCALNNVVDALAVDTSKDADHDALFNVGIMLLNESSANGAYPRKAFIPLTTNNKAALKTLIRSFDRNGDKGTNADFARAMYEAYLYFKGLAPYQGQLAPKRDTAAFNGNHYASPAGASCARNYVILIANGSPQPSENNDALALLGAAGGDTSQITYPTSVVDSSDQKNWADEFARFMRGADVSGRDGAQGIVTHGIAVTGASSDGNYPNFIQGIANAGGGSFHSASNADVLVKALLEIFNEIQAVNSVFAAASLPVSVNARGTYLNQVYMGMFRPDADAKPRWRGNLKQYMFGLDSVGNLSLVDANGTPAISASTGFISPNAVSFWTSPSTYWANQLLGTPPTGSDSADGEIVEKGAAAQRIRTSYATAQTARSVLTCVGCSGSAALQQFASSNTGVTAALLGVSTATDRSTLIDWVRGADNAGDELGPTTTPATTVRPSVHGDVLHSRPAVVNYGGTTGVVVFYGSNDGMLHAINGNQAGSGAGQELWSFIPEEMFGKLNRLRTNTPTVLMPSTPSGLGATPRDYFVDGPIGVYQKLRTDGSVERVVIFVAMRRGGRLLYAFDVTTPSSPTLLWKKSNSQLTMLGQTWSEPRLAHIKGNTGPILVFGGGYDATAEDALPAATTSSMGKAIYILDALSGNTLKQFDVDRSVPADVALVDSDFDGYIDRAYAVDMSGSVYRIDFEAGSASGSPNGPSDWTMYKLADLSGGTTSGRKFFFGPDVIVTRAFTALMFGSGDREKPLLASTHDHFFQILDSRITKGAPGSSTPILFGDLAAAGTSSSTTVPGCYVALATGEKVVNAATSIGGTTYFGTNRPSSAVASQSCSANLGVAKAYAMPLFCVSPSGTTLTGGGLPPTPVSGIVTVGSGDLARKVVFIIGAPNPKNSAIEGSRVTPTIDVPRNRIYWYQEGNR
jgi:type IV pilus assembly protein PilY1